MLTTVFLSSLLAWVTYIDFRIKEIPDAVHIGLIVSAFAASLLGIHLLELKTAWIGLFIGAGMLIVVSIFGPMGGGDIKLMGALGMWFGPLGIIDVFLLSFMFGGIMACVYVIKYRKRKMTIPFGPAIAVGALTVWTSGFSIFG